ncbi:hypothetical protein UREG_06929 [Uncinocarpus reesii 1704]|uniref:Trichothecene 3-O-acetyltransferase-like N-terminal domain-containing protein n=1 Tax=Uncinocarpus reesii (strain UAMH 1704) TaxID=336963 RepID=C4JWI7_UNCRE|nr:uncharacterized protein UREG_06929 [Uncinocarpus reesii 1704]EEP82064.1 hypothetical protein UREG_06929 [Uncinocarpus reesii 1704]
MDEPLLVSKDRSGYYHLDILGQLPLLQIYTQICLCYAVADASSHPRIITTLTNGLERLSASFPWLAGHVVNEGSSENSSGIFKIKPLAKPPPLVVKDLRNDPSMPTMDALRHAEFPFAMLDEKVIAPRKTIPGSPDEPAFDTMPVFLLQATFISGGLLLMFVGQHGAMDMTGQGQVIDLFSKACRNEPFTPEELSSGNLDRRHVIPWLDNPYISDSDAAQQQPVKPPSHGDQPAPFPATTPPKCTWAYFIFSSRSLVALKALATSASSPPSGFISTDDALSAFIWQSISRARLPRLEPTTKSTITRAVDIRRYFNIPQMYPGVAQNLNYHTSTLQKLIEQPLGAVASQFRSAVDPKTSDIEYRTRALATLISRTPDKNTVSITANIDPSTDLMLSSWAKLDCYELDFNLGLDKPEAVRRPRLDPFDGLIYLMPKSRDGEIAVAIGLRDEDLDRLKADEEFNKYGRYIG